MGMISATTALKASQFLTFLFGCGFCFFPMQAMSAYKMVEPTADMEILLAFFIGIMGSQMVMASITNAVTSKPFISDGVKSVACLCNAILFFSFVVTDGFMAYNNTFPEQIPRDSIFANCALFGVIGLVNIMGWMDAGSKMPDFGNMVFKGPLSKAMFANIFNLAFFAVGCKFAAQPFMEMFMPGVLETFDSSFQAFALLIMNNAGQAMLINIVSTFFICSVGDEMVTYQIARGWSWNGMFYLGMLSREGTIFTAMQWAMPMYAMSFVQCMAVTFYTAKSIGDIQVEPVKAKTP